MIMKQAYSHCYCRNCGEMLFKILSKEQYESEESLLVNVHEEKFCSDQCEQDWKWLKWFTKNFTDYG